MTTSQISFLSEILQGGQIPIGKLAYFRSRLTNRIHELVLTEFARLEQNNEISKAELARRIGKKPEQVTRWLGAPGNWTLETFSDLLLGLGSEPHFSISNFSEVIQQENDGVLGAMSQEVSSQSLEDEIGGSQTPRPSLAPNTRPPIRQEITPRAIAA